MTIQSSTICNLIQSFPVLLILAQNHNKCLTTPFIYKPPSPTHSTEYYEALDALFHNLYAQDCNHGDGFYYHDKKLFSNHGPKPCSNHPTYSYGNHGAHGYGSHSYGSGYSGHGYGNHGYGATNGYGYGYVQTRNPTYVYKKANIYNITNGGHQSYAPNQVYSINKYRIVVKKNNKRHRKSEKLIEGLFNNQNQNYGLYPNRRREINRGQSFLNPLNILSNIFKPQHGNDFGNRPIITYPDRNYQIYNNGYPNQYQNDDRNPYKYDNSGGNYYPYPVQNQPQSPNVIFPNQYQDNYNGGFITIPGAQNPNGILPPPVHSNDNDNANPFNNKRPNEAPIWQQPGEYNENGYNQPANNDNNNQFNNAIQTERPLWQRPLENEYNYNQPTNNGNSNQFNNIKPTEGPVWEKPVENNENNYNPPTNNDNSNQFNNIKPTEGPVWEKPVGNNENNYNQPTNNDNSNQFNNIKPTEGPVWEKPVENNENNYNPPTNNDNSNQFNNIKPTEGPVWEKPVGNNENNYNQPTSDANSNQFNNIKPTEGPVWEKPVENNENNYNPPTNNDNSNQFNNIKPTEGPVWQNPPENTENNNNQEAINANSNQSSNDKPNGDLIVIPGGQNNNENFFRPPSGTPGLSPSKDSENLPELTPVPPTQLKNLDIQGIFSPTCRTPVNESGSCRSIYSCPPYLNLLRQASIDASLASFLRKAQCGFEGNTPLVCCPAQTLPTAPPTPTTTTSTTTTTTTTTTETARPKSLDGEDFVAALPEPPVCGTSNATFSRVVGGINAKLGDFPWMALLGYKRKRNPSETGWLCGGSLITARHVLTAAHCIHGHEQELYVVRLGELDLAREDEGAVPVDVLVKAQLKHEGYDPNSLVNDVGVLVLAKEVAFTDLIKPICMPRTRELRSLSFERFNPYIAGWGDTAFRGPAASHLQVLQLPVVSNEFCAKAYSNYKPQSIDERVLCAGYERGGKDACQGDSGGPLMQPIPAPDAFTTYYYQIGVVSYGRRCAEAGFPGVYTRVTYFVPWIEEKVLGSTR